MKKSRAANRFSNSTRPSLQKAQTVLMDRSNWTTPCKISWQGLLDAVDVFGFDATRRLAAKDRSKMGQFMTPQPVAKLLASMFGNLPKTVRLLDAGAGVGALTAAFVAEMIQRPDTERPRAIHAVAYEIEPTLIDYLQETMALCSSVAGDAGIEFTGEIRSTDFIEGEANTVSNHLFPGDDDAYDVAILNPPYKKITNDSETRRRLSNVGIETSNLYTAFVWLAAVTLETDGQLVAITPRSFANGPYFKPFRKMLSRTMSFRRVHIFDSRKTTFASDDVLQENLVYHLVKNTDRAAALVTASAGPDDPDLIMREVAHSKLLRHDDPDAVLHVVPDEISEQIAEQMRDLECRLDDLGIGVSTGRTVEFRAKDRVRRECNAQNTAPLICPHHFRDGFVEWPGRPDRINATTRRGFDDDELLPAGFYVLAKRFSAKEEKKRIVAGIYDPNRISSDAVAFENHLNYFHRNGRGLPEDLAKGLAVFLNSTLVDLYFRQFNGHTQVNASDLRSLHYPSATKLANLGSSINGAFPSQVEIDQLVQRDIFDMRKSKKDLAAAKRKIENAMEILAAIKTPKAQLNERSALTLLSLLDIEPSAAWSDAQDPRRGITEMMDWFRDNYGKRYAPNMRETVRRFTIHQFEQMTLVLKNPDDPRRPPNSPNNVYQVEPDALELIRSFGTEEWEKRLPVYLNSIEGLNRLIERNRNLTTIEVTLPTGEKVDLTAGGQNVLVKEVVEQFCPRFTPAGCVIYLGDAGKKHRFFDANYLANLGVTIDEHGQMPDVVVHHREKNWLILIEAVTSHGPVSLLRHNQLKDLFRASKAGLVFVSTFLDRRA